MGLEVDNREGSATELRDLPMLHVYSCGKNEQRFGGRQPYPRIVETRPLLEEIRTRTTMLQDMWHRCGWMCLVLSIVVAPVAASAEGQQGDEKKKGSSQRPSSWDADKNVSLKAPATWKRGKPRFNMIQYEFAAPAAKEGPADARVTIMGAGGDVKANIARWQGQFHDQGRKFSTKQLDIAGQEVHMVDIAGTYLDRPAGPMMGGKTTRRENYRVLAAILVTTQGRYYIKMYGPQATVAAHEKAFQAMVKTLQIDRP